MLVSDIVRRDAYVYSDANATFLLSDGAGCVTGTSLPIDGGWLGY